MTVLNVAREVADYVGIERPDELYNSSEDEHLELRLLLQEAADQIVGVHDWQLFKFQASYTTSDDLGDSTETILPLPSGFRKFLSGGQLWTSRLLSPLDLVPSINDWNAILVRDTDFVSGAWIRFQDQIRIKPKITTSEEITFWYQGNKIIRPASNSSGNLASDIEEFTADDDVFRLSERLLRLSAIWRFKSLKKQPNEMEKAIFQDALERAILEDGDSRVLVVGRRARRRGVKVAYPVRLS